MALRNESAAGFTLVEVIIAVGIIVAMIAIFEPQLAFYAKHAQKIDTENRLKQLQEALTTAYRENALSIDDAPTNTFDLGATTLVTGQATAAEMSQIASYAGASPGDISLDGFKQPFQIFVSNPLSKQWDGVTLHYHVIAVVSMGADADSAGRRGVDPNTRFDPNTGILNLGGDDMGVVVDGYGIESGLARESRDKMISIANLYANYFQTQYLANVNRDVSVDYFARRGTNSNWDTTSQIQNTAGGTLSVVSANLAATLGIGPSDYTDAYGQTIQVDNSSPQVRNPDNPNANLQTPPFTAAIQTALPGGDVMRVGVSGAY